MSLVTVVFTSSILILSLFYTLGSSILLILLSLNDLFTQYS